jgi:hypothetical protein
MMQFLTTLPRTEGWLEMDALETAESMAAFLDTSKDQKEYGQALLEFCKVVKRMRATSLLDLLLHLSTENKNVRILLIPFTNAIEGELVKRCKFFEEAHPILPT